MCDAYFPHVARINNYILGDVRQKDLDTPIALRVVCLRWTMTRQTSVRPCRLRGQLTMRGQVFIATLRIEMPTESRLRRAAEQSSPESDDRCKCPPYRITQRQASLVRGHGRRAGLAKTIIFRR